MTQEELADITLVGSIWMFSLFGWIIPWFCFWKKEKLVGGAILFVWLAFFLRIPIALFLFSIVFIDDDFKERFFSAVIGDVWIWTADITISLMVLFVLVLIAFIPYALFKKQFVYAAIALILIFPARVSYLESYFVFYPLIDTTHSPQFTLKKFGQIRPGMTRNQVRALIGDSVKNAGQYFAPCEGQTGDNAAAPYDDFAWLNSSVCYDENDLVVETKKMWVPD